MKLTDLTQAQLDAAYIELVYARYGLFSRAFGELEQFYLDRIDLIDPVIDCLKEAARIAGGASDGI